MRSSLRFLILWLAIAAPLFGAEPVKTPPIGSMERKAIMDALRGPVEADLRQAVIFKVILLRVNSQWACMHATLCVPTARGSITAKRAIGNKSETVPLRMTWRLF